MSFFRIILDFLENVRIKSSLLQSGFFFSFFQFCDIKNYNFFLKTSKIHIRKTKSKFFQKFFVKKRGNFFF